MPVGSADQQFCDSGILPLGDRRGPARKGENSPRDVFVPIRFCLMFFPTCFFSIWGPKIVPTWAPKSSPKRLQIEADNRRQDNRKKDRFWDPFLDDFSTIFDQFSRRSLKSSASLFKVFLPSWSIKKTTIKHMALHQKLHL